MTIVAGKKRDINISFQRKLTLIPISFLFFCNKNVKNILKTGI